MVSLREALMLGEGGVISLVGAGGKTSLMFRLAHELCSAGYTVLTTTTTKIFRPDEEQSRHVLLSDSPSEILRDARILLKQHSHISAAMRHDLKQDKLIGFAPEIIDMFKSSGLFDWIIVYI